MMRLIMIEHDFSGWAPDVVLVATSTNDIRAAKNAENNYALVAARVEDFVKDVGERVADCAGGTRPAFVFFEDSLAGLDGTVEGVNDIHLAQGVHERVAEETLSPVISWRDIMEPVFGKGATAARVDKLGVAAPDADEAPRPPRRPWTPRRPRAPPRAEKRDAPAAPPEPRKKPKAEVIDLAARDGVDLARERAGPAARRGRTGRGRRRRRPRGARARARTAPVRRPGAGRGAGGARRRARRGRWRPASPVAMGPVLKSMYSSPHVRAADQLIRAETSALDTPRATWYWGIAGWLHVSRRARSLGGGDKAQICHSLCGDFNKSAARIDEKKSANYRAYSTHAAVPDRLKPVGSSEYTPIGTRRDWLYVTPEESARRGRTCEMTVGGKRVTLRDFRWEEVKTPACWRYSWRARCDEAAWATKLPPGSYVVAADQRAVQLSGNGKPYVTRLVGQFYPCRASRAPPDNEEGGRHLAALLRARRRARAAAATTSASTASSGPAAAAASSGAAAASSAAAARPAASARGARRRLARRWRPAGGAGGRRARVADGVMRCFEAFPGGPGAVRAVLVGKAPYPNAQQAHGLALSAPDGAKKPPCVNTWLYNHLKSDPDCGFGGRRPSSCDLTAWSTRAGVLLLNSALQGAESNAPRWRRFLQSAIRRICAAADARGTPTAFIFLGKGAPADLASAVSGASRACVVRAPFPGQFTRDEFNDARPFATANTMLAAHGAAPIPWNVLLS
ncbi:uracil-DNA glycosylase [Aureococcus anophagefferens]|uniref:Uracil-DNA glycosylase n=1 Tax=Aureococcus anophagefferens TaxID=44056 RepID=A0ABR1G0X2_AURAN